MASAKHQPCVDARRAVVHELVRDLGAREANRIFKPAMPLEQVIDPTGAGDSFAGGFMGFLAASGRVDSDGIRRAAVAGSVTASFAVEDFSLDRLKSLDKGQVSKRYTAFRDLVRIPE